MSSEPLAGRRPGSRLRTPGQTVDDRPAAIASAAHRDSAAADAPAERTAASVRLVPWVTVSLVALLVAGLALRLLLAPYGVFRGDAMIFGNWAVQLVRVPLAELYASGRPIDHLPGDLWLLWGIAHLYQRFSPSLAVQALPFLLLLKLVPAVFDVAIGGLLFLVARRLAGPRAGLFAAGSYLLNPASIFLTAIWGQWDPVSACFLVLALWLLVRGTPEWSLPALTYAALVKPQMALAVPVVAVVWWRWSIKPAGRWPLPAWPDLAPAIRRLALPVAASALVFVAIAVPFDVGLPPLSTRWTLFDRLAVAWNAYPYTSLNAFNLWELVAGGAGRVVHDGEAFLLGASYQTWGTLLLGAVVVLAVALVWRRPTRLMALWATLAITLGMFVLPTRIHERYLLPAVVLAVLVAALVPALRWLGAGLSLTYLANLYWVYTSAQGPGPRLTSQFGRAAAQAVPQPGEPIVTLLSAANVALLLVVLLTGFLLLRSTPRSEQPAA